MKLNAGKRIIMFLHWLASLLICAALVIPRIKPDLWKKLVELVTTRMNARQLKIIAIAALALYAILAIWELVIIFKRRKRAERGFIVVETSESGRVRIAVSAIEQMVRQSVTSIDGISEMKIKIEGNEDSIDIGVNASIVNGGHVPTITMNMQRAIRQFVEMNCGVAVHAVPISIKSVTAPAEGRRRRRREKDAPAIPAPVAETVNEPAPAAEEAPAVEPAPAVETEPAYEEAPAEEVEIVAEEETQDAETEAVTYEEAEPAEESAWEPASEPEAAQAKADPMIAPWDSSYVAPTEAVEEAAEEAEDAFVPLGDVFGAEDPGEAPADGEEEKPFSDEE